MRVKYINTGMLALAAVFLSYTALTATPSSLLGNAQTMLASAGVGVSVAVAPNPYNTLAQQLSNKEAQLNQQSAFLAAQEQTINSSAPTAPANRYGFYSLCVSMALFVLVAINFYFDIRRRDKATPAGTFSVDLR